MSTPTSSSADRAAGDTEATRELATRRTFLRRTAGWSVGALAGLPLVGCRTSITTPEPNTAIRIEPTEVPPRFDALASPDLGDERVLGFRAGLRPYRRGGIALGRDELPDGRPVVHNYGHGGAGITLSWGCAEEVADVVAELDDVRSVLVLGGGVIGLTTAAALRDRNYEVRVVAKEFPPHTTSDVAGGQFAPSLVAVGRGRAARDRLRRRLERSFRRFTALRSWEWGVSEVDNFTVRRRGSLDRIPAGLLRAPRPLERLPFRGRARAGFLYRTLLIEPPVFLPRLVQELRAHEVELSTRAFTDREQLADERGDVIVNCTGLGAGALFDDRSVIPYRGQLVHVEPQEIGYLLSHTGYLFPRRDSIVLGGTVERGVAEPTPVKRACESILRRHRAFFAE